MALFFESTSRFWTTTPFGEYRLKARLILVGLCLSAQTLGGRVSHVRRELRRVQVCVLLRLMFCRPSEELLETSQL